MKFEELSLGFPDSILGESAVETFALWVWEAAKQDSMEVEAGSPEMGK